MSIKQGEIVLVLVLLAFLGGRYSAPEKVVTEIKTVTVEVEKKETEKETDKQVTTTSIIRPDGTHITRTRVQNIAVQVQKESDSNQVSVDDKKTVENSAGTSFSAMAGVKDWSLIYGISATKPFLGPLTIGVWGLSDASFGLSLGLRL